MIGETAGSEMLRRQLVWIKLQKHIVPFVKADMYKEPVLHSNPIILLLIL